MISLKNISVLGQKTPLINRINLNINRREHRWIHGPCGSGKSILASIIAGQRRYTEGELLYENYWGGSPFDHIRMISFTDNSSLFRGVNASHYYQQRFNAWDSDGHLTVRQYLNSGRLSGDLDSHSELLAELGLESLLDVERIKLSSGQHRKMFIARVLMQDPKILILDNLYVGLDKDAVKFVNGFLDDLVSQRDITLVIFGHHDDLPKCVKHETILSHGTVSYDGRHIKKVNSIKQDDDRGTYDEIMRDAFKRKGQWPDSKDILEFNDVSISYSGKALLNNFNWTVSCGEKWVLAGNNGSGKSLVVSLIYGDNPQAHANEIILFGMRLGPGLSIWEIKKHIGFTSPELHAYFRGDMTFEEVIRSGKYDFLHLPSHDEGIGEFGLLLINYFDVQHLKERSFFSLSTGEQRMCLLIRALIKNPALILLDEPFQGMDDKFIDKSKRLLSDLLSPDHTVILITHDSNHVPDGFGLIKEL